MTGDYTDPANLDDLDEDYEAAQPEERKDFGPMMPDGPQQALLVDLAIRVRQSDEHRQLYAKWQNRRGSVRDWRDLDADNGVGLKIAKGDLLIYGFEGKMSELHAWIESGEWKGLVVNINKKTKPGDTRDFVDVYVNGSAGKTDNVEMFDVDPAAAAQFVPAGADPDFEGFQGSDDDIPFAPTIMSSGPWGI